MKRILFKLSILLPIVLISISSAHLLHAEVDWRTIKEIPLDVAPLDMTTSADGELIFVLVPGEILVYSTSEDRVTDHIPVDKTFDRLAYSSKPNSLILTGSSARILRVIQLEFIYNVEVSGSPLKGAEDAPVTVAYFSDYQ